MKLYAIRDRMLDYYMHPWAAPDDKQAMAGIATQVNNPDAGPISQAPQHFELWELGTINETGDITAQKTIICNCANLIRTETKEKAHG